jgi:fatty-acyl-CoA synthase
MENIAKTINITPDDKIAVPTYLFYIFGNLQKVLCPNLKGASVVLFDRFDVEEILKTIEKEKCTILDGVPTVFNQYLSFPGFNRYTYGSLRTGRIAGAPTSAQLIESVIEKLHIPELHSMYGMTECTGATTVTQKGDPSEILSQTVGKALPGAETAIIDPESGQKLGMNEDGELLVKGHLVLKEYYKKKTETEEAINPEGWFHTGDLVRQRSDGYFEFVGRIKDIIKRGGENVSVAEVENTICGHPAVLQCEVVGVSDAKYDEVGMAFVILREGMSCTSEEIIAFCRKRLSSFKIPKYVEFMEEYPVTATGKVQKFKLRELAKEIGSD